jgi:hypothetical protein
MPPKKASSKMDHQLQVFMFFVSSLSYLSTFLPSFPKTLILVCPFEQHGAIRTTLSSLEDYEVDDEVGFQRIEAREIDTLGETLSLRGFSSGLIS